MENPIIKSNVIKFPTKQYNILERREDYVEDFFSAVAYTARELNIELDDHEEFGAIFSMLRDIVDSHLNLEDYENYEFGEGVTEV